MMKYVACCFFFLSMACGTTIEIETEENYEAFLLPDGSQVYLNHQSTLSYNENFNPRTVNLIGEAFFTVVSDESIFTVSTTQLDIEVLGTEFNVNATSNQVTVDVKKGLVELKTAFNKSRVKKGIKAIYKDGEQTVQQLKSDKEYQEWIRSLQKEFKKLGKELKPIIKKIGVEFEKVGKKIGDDFKK